MAPTGQLSRCYNKNFAIIRDNMVGIFLMIPAQTCPRTLTSNALNGTYITAETTNATSNPTSPVVFAIGPTNQAWSIHGMISPNEDIPAARAAMPEGNRR